MTIYAVKGKRPVLPDRAECFIAPNACVIGDVVMKPLSSIWFGAVVRGDNEAITIGERSNIQDNCVLHTDPGFPLEIGKSVTVGHLATLHGCTIGDGTLVGMGATVLNGAKIGRNSVIGAHALVPEGKEIPDNSLVVGIPGKVVRTMDEKHACELSKLADHYVARLEVYNSSFEAVDEGS